MDQTLLRRYLRLTLEANVRVPQQLIDPDKEEDTDEEQETTDDNVQEFSGGGAISGFTAPLGMGADDMQTPKPKQPKKKKGLTA